MSYLHCLNDTLQTCKELTTSALETIPEAFVHGPKEVISSIRTACSETGSFFTRTISKIHTKTHDAIAYVKPILTHTYQKVMAVVIPTLAAIAAFIAFLSNTSLFIIGGVAAILAPKEMSSAIKSITDIWNKQNHAGKAILITTLAIAWPVTMGLSSFFVGSAVSLWLQDRAKSTPDASEQPVIATQ